jgi:hypothetical protein
MAVVGLLHRARVLGDQILSPRLRNRLTDVPRGWVNLLWHKLAYRESATVI